MHSLTISVLWRHRGLYQPVYRERLTITLGRPLTGLMSAAVLARQPGLESFDADGAGGIIRERNFFDTWTAQHARSRACMAARFLMFMDATGLRKWSMRGICPSHPWDHTYFWYLPGVQPHQYVFTTEPYHDDEMPGVDRPAIRSSWPGMWNPPQTSLWLIEPSRKPAVPLDALAEALDRLPPPPTVWEWPGEDTTQITRLAVVQGAPA